MEPKWCSKHFVYSELIQTRYWKCRACYNERKVELAKIRRDDTNLNSSDNIRRRARYHKNKNDPLDIARRAADRGKRKDNGKSREYTTIRNETLKRSAFEAYGGVECLHCGEKTLDKLALDHKNNNGHEFRKETKMSGTKLYFWLKKQNWPDGYQVLCHNCNIMKRAERYTVENPTARQSNQSKRCNRMKLAVTTHYGNGASACVRCGFNSLAALTLDHINNDGHLTRHHSPGVVFYYSLIKQGFPEGFQTLCFSCNMEKEIQLRR